MQDHDFASAARLAFDLKHPGRLLSVIQRTAGGVAVGGSAGQEARRLLSGLVGDWGAPRDKKPGGSSQAWWVMCGVGAMLCSSGGLAQGKRPGSSSQAWWVKCGVGALLCLVEIVWYGCCVVQQWGAPQCKRPGSSPQPWWVWIVSYLVEVVWYGCCVAQQGGVSQGKRQDNSFQVPSLASCFTCALGKAASIWYTCVCVLLCTSLMRVYTCATQVEHMSDEDVRTALEYCRSWNTNTRNCHAAHAMLKAILAHKRPAQLLNVPGKKSVNLLLCFFISSLTQVPVWVCMGYRVWCAKCENEQVSGLQSSSVGLACSHSFLQVVVSEA
eukprot:1154560-Pelagomonas_calceolata.AAC.5